MSLLSIQKLSVSLKQANQNLLALDDFELNLSSGESYALVGPSGSGKTLSMHALCGMLSEHATMYAENISFHGQNFLTLPWEKRRLLLGNSLCWIPKNPQAALHPHFTIGEQLKDNWNAHHNADEPMDSEQLERMLSSAQLPTDILQAYPSQLDAVQAFFVYAVMAQMGDVQLLIVDDSLTHIPLHEHPRIVQFLLQWQNRGVALILLTQQWACAQALCQRAAVIYAGQMMEVHHIPNIMRSPAHPYTQASVQAELANPSEESSALQPGDMPKPSQRGRGCLLADRCTHHKPKCDLNFPILLPISPGNTHTVRCFYPILHKA